MIGSSKADPGRSLDQRSTTRPTIMLGRTFLLDGLIYRVKNFPFASLPCCCGRVLRIRAGYVGATGAPLYNNSHGGPYD